ncbi:hypothetical protein [Myxococcus sp. Y35]|uniref:hypothetical protein n=1 Tax=Pseudomyxococcus flavus TaxID=3115648 RepID=UPI003CF3A615
MTGLRVEEGVSLVRVFKVWSPTASGPAPGKVRYERDRALEQALTAALPPDTVVELDQGRFPVNPQRAPVRDASFYLERWALEGTGGLDAHGRCSRHIKGMRALIQPGFTLLVGEQLGSQEAPAAVGDLVCEAAEAGQDVALGLSIPRTEQESVDRYLSSLGAPADQDALLKGVFWRRPYQDGRSSWAIVDLLDRVRALRASGLPITVVAFDTDGTVVGSERDAKMAAVWTARRAEHQDEAFIVLAGNAHMQIARGTRWDAQFEPMAWLLAKSERRLTALDLSFSAGRRWGCDLTAGSELQCQVVEAEPSERVAGTPGQSPHIRLFSSFSWGFHGLLYVGALSPSMPATSLAGHAPPPEDPLLAPRKGTQRRVKLY